MPLTDVPVPFGVLSPLPELAFALLEPSEVPSRGPPRDLDPTQSSSTDVLAHATSSWNVCVRSPSTFTQIAMRSRASWPAHKQPRGLPQVLVAVSSTPPLHFGHVGPDPTAGVGLLGCATCHNNTRTISTTRCETCGPLGRGKRATHLRAREEPVAFNWDAGPCWHECLWHASRWLVPAKTSTLEPLKAASDGSASEACNGACCPLKNCEAQFR